MMEFTPRIKKIIKEIEEKEESREKIKKKFFEEVMEGLIWDKKEIETTIQNMIDRVDEWARRDEREKILKAVEEIGKADEIAGLDSCPWTREGIAVHKVCILVVKYPKGKEEGCGKG